MPNKVLLKKSSVAAKVPLAADLDYGEIALNYQDGKIYYKKADNSIDAFVSGAPVSGVSNVAGNTGAVTATQLLTAINTVDGSGSGLDADLLDGINGASLIRSDIADTFLNITSENGIESLKVGGYTTTAAIQASYSTSFAAQPMAAQIWHDLLAFSKNYTTTYETYNGTTWSSATVNKELFAQKENQTIQITNGTTITRARWTFTDVAYSSADWLVIGHTWNTPTPNKTILVESSPDGVTWYTKHNSTYDNIAVTMFHKLDSYYGDSRLRITITWNSGGDVRLSNMKLLTCRPGDQGRGVEDQYPYLVDGNQNITTGGNLTIGAGKTFSSPTAIVSTLATGTAPFTVASTTLVNNLNSQYLNGQQGSYYLDTSATAQTKTGDLTITGNLTVNGTTTTINSTTLTVDDKNLELGSIASPTDTTADGGGITLKGATDKTFNWVQSTGYWTASNSLSSPQHISTVATGTAPLIVASTTLVTNLNADLLGGVASSSYVTLTGTQILTNKTLTAPVINGSVNFDSNTLFVDSVNDRIGIGTGTPSTRLQVGVKVADDNTYTYDANSLYVVHQTGTSTTVLNDPKEVLLLGRQGTSGQAYGAAASFRLSRYENNSTNSRTRLDLVLAHDSFLNSPAIVLTARSDGNVGIGTTAPSFALQIVNATPILSVGTTGNTGGSVYLGNSNHGVNRGGASGSNDVSLYTTSGNLYLSANGLATTSHLTVLNNGNVGIGTITTSIAKKFTVVGEGNFTDASNNTRLYMGWGTIPTTGGTGGYLFNNDNSSLVFGTTNTERMRILATGDVGIGTSSPAYKLEVNGSFAATTKSFVIDHPTKPDMKLRYGSLEGPENGVYVRGRLKGNKIELPDYWTKLVDPESITVSLTSVGKHQDLYVKSIENNTITVANSNLVAKGIDCFYVVYGERCDVDKLQVEIAK